MTVHDPNRPSAVVPNLSLSDALLQFAHDRYGHLLVEIAPFSGGDVDRAGVGILPCGHAPIEIAWTGLEIVVAGRIDREPTPEMIDLLEARFSAADLMLSSIFDEFNPPPIERDWSKVVVSSCDIPVTIDTVKKRTLDE